MSSPNLLITGVTGFVGFKVLLSSLQEGYNVRAAVRSADKIKYLSSHPKILALDVPDKLSFVEIPNICGDGAYDEAVKGVTYIIHHASPLPSPFLDPETGIYEPNIKSVDTLLKSALTESSVKRVVITSSIFANTPFPPDPKKEITAESRVPNELGPFEAMLPAYRAGKIAALNLTDKFIESNRPSFSVVTIFPGFIFGWDDRALNAQDLNASSNRILLAVITGQNADNPMPAGAINVADAAKVHLLALKKESAKNIGATVVHRFNDAWNIVEKYFPKAVANGIFTQGNQPTAPVFWNAHQTEIDFGFNFKTFEDMVVEVASQYLELSGKEKA